MDAVLTWVSDAYNSHGWMFQVFIIILLTATLNFIESKTYLRLYQQFQKSKHPWDDEILRALHRPLSGFIWLIGVCIAAEVIHRAEPGVFLFQAIGPMRKVGILIFIIWFVIRLIHRIERRLSQPRPGHKNPDKTTIIAIGKLLRAAVLVAGGLVILQTLGFGISTILAFGGIGGAAVALASQQLLGNYFGGLILYFNRPFKIGDWIRSPDKNIEGTVEHIGWVLTTIRTFDKRPLYVPNSVFTQISVENPSRMQNRRIKTNIGLRYEDADVLPTIVDSVVSMLKAHPEIDVNQTMIVNFVAFGASSLDFMVYTFTKTTNWIKFQEIQQDVLLKIYEIVREHGADIAFPTRTLQLPESMELK